MPSISYSKLLDPLSDAISCMESLLAGAFGTANGDQRECCKRIHAYCWGLHTLVMDVVTAIGIENAATRPAVLERFHSLMRPAKSNLDSLAAGYDGPLNSDQQQIIAFASSTASSIERMMNNLWRFSLLTHNMLDFTPSPVSCDTLTRKVRSILPSAPSPANIPQANVHGDQLWLSRALSEIALNIWHHGNPNHIAFHAQPNDSHIDITLFDAGDGFTARDMDEPFQPFWQSDEHNQGLGLGLFLAKNFIEMSGGAITIDSQPDQGALVTLSLALAD